MGRSVFFSFHFQNDHWRAAQVRSMGTIEGTAELSDNDWEAVKKRGDAAISSWIDAQMRGTTCTVVLVGSSTAGRKWIDYEIKKAWELKKGLVGIRINKLLNSSGQSDVAGANPFANWNVKGNPMTNFVSLHDPVGFDSKQVYRSIADNIDAWVEAAIKARG
jgi:hypothetical protein